MTGEEVSVGASCGVKGFFVSFFGGEDVGGGGIDFVLFVVKFPGGVVADFKGGLALALSIIEGDVRRVVIESEG